MDSTEEYTEMYFLDNLNPPGLNDFLVKLCFRFEVYCIMDELVNGMHMPMNKIHDTSQLNL
jgi:hypothetical protein